MAVDNNSNTKAYKGGKDAHRNRKGQLIVPPEEVSIGLQSLHFQPLPRDAVKMKLNFLGESGSRQGHHRDRGRAPAGRQRGARCEFE